jgi:hypothetical protein
MNQLMQRLPTELKNKIFFYAAVHPTSVIFNNYKQNITSNINTDRSYDFDYYMRIPNTTPIPYSYYRDITYNLFYSSRKQAQIGANRRKQEKMKTCKKKRISHFCVQ